MTVESFRITWRCKRTGEELFDYFSGANILEAIEAFKSEGNHMHEILEIVTERGKDVWY